MKKIVKLTEADLVRIVKRVIKENMFGGDDIDPALIPGTTKNYVEGPGRIGHKDYEAYKDAEIERSRKFHRDREEEMKYHIPTFYNGREWKDDELRAFVMDRFGIELPDFVFDREGGAPWYKAKKYIKSTL